MTVRPTCANLTRTFWCLLFPNLELRRLRRRLPHVHRGWVRVPKIRGRDKIRPETDAEYRQRLTRIAHERARTARRGNVEIYRDSWIGSTG
jgi:hypothetical protein